MGTVKVCDGRCHGAKGPDCDCWCGGMFHGAAGEQARRDFMTRYGALPKDQDVYEDALKQRLLFEAS